MTKLFEHAVDVARGLPPEVQDDLARVLLELAGENQPVVETDIGGRGFVPRIACPG
jgi:hypothetical protein